MREAIRSNYEGLVQDRDHLAFSAHNDAALKKLLAFLATDRIEVRRYEKAFLHGKAFIFSDDEGVLAGSSNFTAAGLTSNMELNLGRYDPTPVGQVKQWFDDLWAEAMPFDLASIYAARFEAFVFRGSRPAEADVPVASHALFVLHPAFWCFPAACSRALPLCPNDEP